MKKIIILFVLFCVFAAGQCMAPIKTRVGFKIGINPGTYNYDDGGDTFGGMGMHFGLGMGTDIFNLVGLDFTPQFRTTKYGRDEALSRHSYSYSSLYFPMFLSLKAGMLPLISPYLGIGIGINVVAKGIERFEFNNGSAVENEIGGANSGHAIIGLGAEIKLTQLRIVPEFTAHVNGSADNENTPQTEENVDYHISVGLYYAP